MKNLIENYRFTNLEELRETIDTILLSASIAAKRKVHPSEIALESENGDALTGSLIESTLTDGSTVYSVEFDSTLTVSLSAS